MGGSSSGDMTKTIRYAPYIETQHQSFLSHVMDTRELLIGTSPYGGYVDLIAEEAFFSFGNTIASFPSMYDMFGKFMAAFDVDKLWSDIFGNHANLAEINGSVTTSMVDNDANISDKNLPEFMLAMREMNAVSSSTCIVGKAVIEDRRIKVMGAVLLDAFTPLLTDVAAKYHGYLNWQKEIINQYGKGMKLYYLFQTDIDSANTTFATRDTLWPFTVMDFERPALGAMRKASSYDKKMSPRERSGLSKTFLVLSYTATGASVGFEVGGPWGAVIGAVIGVIVGLAIMLLE